jgi:hypothetical protein
VSDSMPARTARVQGADSLMEWISGSRYVLGTGNQASASRSSGAS